MSHHSSAPPAPPRSSISSERPSPAHRPQDLRAASSSGTLELVDPSSGVASRQAPCSRCRHLHHTQRHQPLRGMRRRHCGTPPREDTQHTLSHSRRSNRQRSGRAQRRLPSGRRSASLPRHLPQPPRPAPRSATSPQRPASASSTRSLPRTSPTRGSPRPPPRSVSRLHVCASHSRVAPRSPTPPPTTPTSPTLSRG